MSPLASRRLERRIWNAESDLIERPLE